jgi:HEAT repeat protein
MRHSVPIAPLLLAALAIAAPRATAHGGQYRPPADAGAGSIGGGISGAPPTNPQGVNGPTEGSPGSGTGSGVDGQGQNGKNGRGQTRTGFELQDSTSSWESWWDANKDKYLDLRDRPFAGTRTRGISPHMTGFGRHDSAGPTRRPDTSRVEGDVAPLLQQLLAAGGERDVLDSAVLALARSSRLASAESVIHAALPLLAHHELSVQTSAAISLGVLGSPLAVEQLTALATDSSAGRTLAGGRGPVPSLVRAFAALSLGLLDDAGSVPTLCELVATSDDGDRDLKACAIVALGLMDNERSPEALHFLVGRLSDRKLDAVLGAYVPTAIGKLASRAASPDPSVLPALLAAFQDRDTDAMVRQSLAIALGLLGEAGAGESRDTPVVQALLDFVAVGKDAGTRQFGLIALAQIAARDDEPGAHAGVHAAIQHLLAHEITKPTSAENRPWATLAAALYGRAQPGVRADFSMLVSEAYAAEKNPSLRAADALALGLLEVQGMAATIFEDFQTTTESTFRGYAALALGFLGHTDAAERLRVECRAKTITPGYRMQVATALGLLGDREAVAVLSETLENAQTLGVSAAVAKALGLIGDESAIAPLMQIAADPSKSPLTRGFACVALGRLCEKTSLPWNAAIMADNNYLVAAPAIAEVCDIL